MKSNRKTKTIILIILGILCALSPIITTNINLKYSEFSMGINLDKKNLKILKVSEKIHIDDTNPSMNWSVAKKDGICTGNGTYSDPYVIEDLVINGGGSGDCILIENSNVYFRIENCTVYNSEIYPFIDIQHLYSHFAGIRLSGVNNAQLLINNCSFNNDGIYVGGFNNTISGNIANNNINGSGIVVSGFNTVTGNTANNNDYPGILLGGNNITVSGNIAMNNNWASIDIMLLTSNYNNISGNTAGIQLLDSDHNIVSGNNVTGIGMAFSDYNTISGNTVSWRIILQDCNYNIVSGNDACWVEKGDCNGNIFSDNNGPCLKEDDFLIELIIIISVFSGGAVIGVATLLLIRRKRKRIE